ncbi:MAG TPA: ribose 5-phosphate isomerase B [Syntrophorhabdaceae bacterium]|nr:ribose 5-phosphate isomerase B [Syntrophorhabdaceae bacterium]
MKKIAIGADHAGYELKEHIKNILIEAGYDVLDFGTDSEASVDYPYFGFEVAKAVSDGKAETGILFCGTGIGMSVVANKVKGIRAALVNDLYTAIQSRRHNNANILVLGGRILGKGIAEEIVKTWLSTPFDAGRHEKRLEKITEWEKAHFL